MALVAAEATRTGRLVALIRGRIASRALGRGARLPSVRALAASEGVAKSTVVEAYERLVAEGLVRSRPGSGFFVLGAPTRPALAPPASPVERALDPLWIMRQSLEADPALLIPGCGWLPESWLPAAAIRRGLRAAARASDRPLVGYGAPLGFARLRDQLARRLAERGVEADPAQILLADSGTQAIDLVCRHLLEPGDAVLVDDPCYFNFLGQLRAHRVRVAGIPMTPGGPDLDAFAQVARELRPRLYLTNAGPHNPTGATLAPATAHRLLKLAEAHDFTIVEDDVFADLEPAPGAPRLAALDGLQRVIQLGSFSKTLSAAVRCGWIAARPDLVGALTDLKLATTFGACDLAARLVHDLLTDGSYRRHVEGLRTKLARATGPAAARLEAAGLRLWCEPRGGLFLWAELPNGLAAADVTRHALAEGVLLAPGPVFSASRGAQRHLRFNVAHCAQPRLFEVLRRAMAWHAADGRDNAAFLVRSVETP
jgi:DNA-binding transcriptional MocR family regulator